jgi:hypothetical protein
MPIHVSRLGRSAIAALAALVLGLAVPAGARAAGDCPQTQAERVFSPWLDFAWYVPAPDGGLEDGGAGWTLQGGAAVQQGNETHHVGGAGDTRSLRLPTGSVATTAPMCIGLEHPTVRFFARNTGSPLSLLRVSVVYDGVDGRRHALPIGSLAAGSSWAPTLPLPVTANLLALLADQRVQFRFAPANVLLGQGRWSIDDVYVDPYKKG